MSIWAYHEATDGGISPYFGRRRESFKERLRSEKYDESFFGQGFDSPLVHFGGTMRKILILLICVALILCGCSGSAGSSQTEPGFGGNVIRIEIKDLGSVDIRLFDNDSSEAYNLFLEKIEDGSYKGASVSAVIKDYLFMVRAAGIPADTEAREGMRASELFKRDPESDVYPIYGSVLVSENFTADGSFMIITSDKENIKEIEDMLHYKGVTLSEYLLNAYGTKLSEEELDIYREEGGAPWLYGVYPCIGQVFGGMDLIERILREANTADESYRPVEDLVISDIVIAD